MGWGEGMMGRGGGGGGVRVAVVGGLCACGSMRRSTRPADTSHHEPSPPPPPRTHQGRKLTEVINSGHTNPKYLPGVELGEGGNAWDRSMNYSCHRTSAWGRAAWRSARVWDRREGAGAGRAGPQRTGAPHRPAGARSHIHAAPSCKGLTRGPSLTHPTATARAQCTRPGPNVVADPDLESAVADADIIIFCAPHQVGGARPWSPHRSPGAAHFVTMQTAPCMPPDPSNQPPSCQLSSQPFRCRCPTPGQFIRGICKQLIGKVKPDAIAVSLTKVGARARAALRCA